MSTVYSLPLLNTSSTSCFQRENLFHSQIVKSVGIEIKMFNFINKLLCIINLWTHSIQASIYYNIYCIENKANETMLKYVNYYRCTVTLDHFVFWIVHHLVLCSELQY
jgi:hypothetical protein